MWVCLLHFSRSKVGGETPASKAAITTQAGWAETDHLGSHGARAPPLTAWLACSVWRSSVGPPTCWDVWQKLVLRSSQTLIHMPRHSKPISESLGLKQKKLYHQKGSPVRRQGASPKSALPNRTEGLVIDYSKGTWELGQKLEGPWHFLELCSNLVFLAPPERPWRSSCY